MRRKDVDAYVVDALNLAQFHGQPWLAECEIANVITMKHEVELTQRKLGSSLLRLELDEGVVRGGWFRLRDGADPNQYESWDGPYNTDYLDQISQKEYDRVQKYKLIEDTDVDDFLRRIPEKRQKAKFIIPGLIRPNFI